MARIGRGNTFEVVANVCCWLSVTCFVLTIMVWLQHASPIMRLTAGNNAFIFIRYSLPVGIFLGFCSVFFHGLADIVHHLMSISQNTRDTARKLQEMSVPRDSEQPPLP